MKADNSQSSGFPNKSSIRIIRLTLYSLLTVVLLTSGAFAANVITNGTFDSNVSTGWTNGSSTQGDTAWDSSVFGNAPGSLRGAVINRNRQFQLAMSQSLGTINAADTVLLSLWWRKAFITANGAASAAMVRIVRPIGDSVDVWTNTQTPTVGSPLSGTVTELDISSFFTTSGIYTLRLIGDLQSGNDRNAQATINFDDVVLDVRQPAANNPPTVTAGATAISTSPVNRADASTTTISTAFSDSDAPGVSAFNVIFKIREPNNSTELTLVNNLPNGSGGLSITDQGGGNYTASYTYDPAPTQTIGLYDLYFEVTDGSDNVIDNYTSNLNELDIYSQVAPTVTAGATTVSAPIVNRQGTNVTTISTSFIDTDQPGVGAFNITFKIREPNNSTELTLVNAQPNGSGGLSITDDGGGSYTASYSYDPGPTQTVGLYDLYFEVSDGSANAIDPYSGNLDELEIIQQTAPTVVAGATTVTPGSVNRAGVSTTVISASFADSDIPGVGAFTVTFKAREPNNTTELTLVNALTNGNGGLTISDQGGGNYTASYSYDPGPAQTLGLYDLYFEVTDGAANAIDNFAANLDELDIYQQIAPTIVAGATASSKAVVNRIDTDNTVISALFTDLDQPGIGTFTVTMKAREPNNSTELILVNAQTNGFGGLTITNGGGGNYTASYTYNPNDAQTVGLYDLYFEVSDGVDNAIDGFAANLDELEIIDAPPNNPPTVTAGASIVSVSPINRVGANTTVLSTLFSDADIPGVGAFMVTFKIREPDNTTEITLVNAQGNGSGGLTITDQGGGNYTASYTYDPSDIQTLGLYDLYFEVSDGTDNVVDGYANNLDELNIYQQIAPTVVAGATSTSKTSVNRFGSDNTVLSAVFTDLDQPGIGAFTVTIKVREPNNTTELTLVNAQTNGSGGLTIIDGGGGSYTASFTYNPDDAQTVGLYDLYFEVSDGTDNVIDDFTNNLDELDIYDAPPNNPPTMVASATTVSASPVNRYDSDLTVISATFSDLDSPGVGAFNVTFKIREPNNVTELTLVNNLANGAGGLSIVDNGGGSYTASYSYDPAPAQTLGLYDLYFEVSDGTDNLVDAYSSNLDELEINEILPPIAPSIVAGATAVSSSPVNRLDANSTVISATFNDGNSPAAGSFLVTFKIREPDNTTELVLVNAQSNGVGSLTVVDNGGGSYTASYTYDPADTQTLGLYDLYCEVDDNSGTANAIDGFADNLDELQINEVISNLTPVIIASATEVSPASIDRAGAITTTLSVTFTDGDQPGINEFFITLMVSAPYFQGVTTVADSLKHGQGGLTIVDNGGGSYTASILWDPPDNAVTGYYDLRSIVADQISYAVDEYADNPNELLITNGGENSPPIVSTDAVFASPAGVERIGANPTTISATFTDGDAPAVSQFRVSFKIREPNNTTEIIMATNAAHGTSGVTITDLGGGVYTASVIWDPADAQTLGFYDLYFHVTDQIDTSYDDYVNNLDELEVYDAVSNNAPTLTSGNTFVLPTSINRIGSDFTMIKSVFTDVDLPGIGAFTITIKVRDQSLAEYTLVNTAVHPLQGLRVTHIGGGVYEASVLWDPADAQATGTYDLYFSVQDNAGASVIDDYASNADELTVTSAALLGDGNLLKRSNTADNCGGTASACHNIADHQSQDCTVCHAPHSTRNIYLVRETIQTPNSGPKTVLFKTKTGALGDPNSGGMADSTDGVWNGVCEVCHTTTGHHRNDGSQPGPNHNDATDCTGCHPHTDGFTPSGGGEGGGGDGCTCHSGIVTPLTTSTTSYHHQLSSDNGDYTIASKTCLQCHVNHDIFRPDLNTGFGQRAKNLRVDISTPVVQGSSTVLTNTDYSSTGTGGICLSCHTSSQTKGFTPPDGSSSTIAISKAGFDAATAHNYTTTSGFSDGSTFSANCVKCHNDTMVKSKQTSTNKFSTHDNPYGRILNDFGAALPTDPMEEKVCYACHSTSSNPNAGTSQDYYATATMSSTALRVEQTLGLAYGHPTEIYSGRHSAGETAAGLADGNRHAECVDCHSVHAAQKGTHDGSTNLVSGALKGVWGVRPTSWPTPVVPTNNANVFSAPTGYTVVNDATLKEYEICLKCHSNYTTLPSGARNLAAEINPNYPSTHGITIANQNSYCNTTTMFEPWASSGMTLCSDCHRSDNSSDPDGPHGSNAEHLLVASIVSNDVVGTPLCDVCHNPYTYWSGSASASRYSQHPSTKGSHQLPKGCFSCHMWDFASQAGNGVQTSEVFTDGELFVHGQNKKWVVQDDGGGTGSGLPVDAFCNGYLADVDYAAFSCWSDGSTNDCGHTHNGQAY